MTADTWDKWGLTPLSRAAVGGHEPVARLLLSRTDVAADSQDNKGRTPLSNAAEGGFVQENEDVTQYDYC